MLAPDQVTAMLRLHALGWSFRRIAQELGCSRETVKRYVDHGGWQPCRQPRRTKALDGLEDWLAERFRRHTANANAVHQELAAEHGVEVSLRTLQRRVAQWRTVQEPKCDAFEWMLAVLQRKISREALNREVGELPDLPQFLRRLYNGRLSDRNRSMVVLARHRGLGSRVVCAFLGISRTTHRRYLRIFERGGAAKLLAPQIRYNSKFEDVSVGEVLFSTVHEPPSNYGINRTSWKMSDLCRVLREKGRSVCPQVVRRITKAAGYRWCKARVVLTSHDPAYSEKLDRIRTILSDLGPDEAFFSIDEFGPFAVRTTPGRTLTAPGGQRVVPQWQKSRGSLILTAALELSGNQVTHFYSTKKNTAEMIRMMELLVERYGDRRKLYLSWDGASWHVSKRLYERIGEHNAAVLGHGPIVDTAPLPSGAQFLNVIESVFSGMARAIIHNSDYQTLDEAKAAIDRYFDERNEHYRLHPRKAGDKIWCKEREPAVFSKANNCKDPHYR